MADERQDPRGAKAIVMAKRFKVGDRVSWNSEAGRVSGTIVEIHTRDTDYKGHSITRARRLRSTSSRAARPTTWLVRQHRLDGGPLVVGEFVAHDSMLSVWELESRAGRRHQPAKAHRGGCQYPDFTSAFRGITDMAGAVAGLVPVANDPERTQGAPSQPTCMKVLFDADCLG